ncbi:hypothetical protein ACQEU6_24740 [Spirillospora sp. CA-108201]
MGRHLGVAVLGLDDAVGQAVAVRSSIAAWTPGPPGLKNSVPRRSPVALRRTTDNLILRPAGAAQSSGTSTAPHSARCSPQGCQEIGGGTWAGTAAGGNASKSAESALTMLLAYGIGRLDRKAYPARPSDRFWDEVLQFEVFDDEGASLGRKCVDSTVPSLLQSPRAIVDGAAQGGPRLAGDRR